MTPTFEEFVAGAWKTACHDRCKPSTRRRAASALRTRLLPAFGPLPLDRIDRMAVHRWFDDYSRTAPGGANRTLDVLRQILNYAIVCGHVAANPTRGVRRNPRPKPTRFLSAAEIERLHAALDAHRGRGSGRQQADIIRLLLLTGCRKSELVGLRWSEVDEDVLHLRDGKTGPRTVFLNVQARSILARQPRTGGAYVFPSVDRRLGDPLVGAVALAQGAPAGRDRGRAPARPSPHFRKLRRDAERAATRRVTPARPCRDADDPALRARQRPGDRSGSRTRRGGARVRPGRAPVVHSCRLVFEPTRGTAGSEDAVNLTPNCAGAMLPTGMETVNALELRQSLGKVLDQLERGGEPILVCRRRTPAAALVSLKDYRERFVDRDADEQRRKSWRG